MLVSDSVGRLVFDRLFEIVYDTGSVLIFRTGGLYIFVLIFRTSGLHFRMSLRSVDSIVRLLRSEREWWLLWSFVRIYGSLLHRTAGLTEPFDPFLKFSVERLRSDIVTLGFLSILIYSE